MQHLQEGNGTDVDNNKNTEELTNNDKQYSHLDPLLAKISGVVHQDQLENRLENL
jgi:hypothetical protein